jgi:regulator of protease activity HflC (stomatin/prohibitin superfamily)
MYKNKGQSEIIIASVILLTIPLVIGFCMYVLPTYGIWKAEMDGKAELANAEYSKQVAVQTAKAKNESAKYEAEAEVTRAQGVAKANAIIGKSLQGNEDYLKYLWINQLENGKNSTVYVPTEANLPILEAGHRPVKGN